jgi:hypothetical protein
MFSLLGRKPAKAAKAAQEEQEALGPASAGATTPPAPPRDLMQGMTFDEVRGGGQG